MYVLAYRLSRKSPIGRHHQIAYHGFIENRMFQIKIRRSTTGREG
jgi:hypothetical protein